MVRDANWKSHHLALKLRELLKVRFLEVVYDV